MDFDWAFVRDETLKLAAEHEGERFTPALPAGLDRTVPAVVPALVNDIDGIERLTVASAQVAGQSLPGDPASYESAGRPSFTRSSKLA